MSPMELGTLLEWFAGLLAVLPEAAAAELKIATKLDKQQRARVHEFVTAKFDRQLETTSRGVDEARCIHVTRKGAAAAARPALGEEQEAKAKLLYRAARAAGLANMSADEIRDRIAGDDLGGAKMPCNNIIHYYSAISHQSCHRDAFGAPHHHLVRVSVCPAAPVGRDHGDLHVKSVEPLPLLRLQ